MRLTGLLDQRDGAWALRVRLLGPTLLLILVAAIGWGALNEFSTRGQVGTLVQMQANAVLEGIDQQLQEQRRAKEVFAQLLADQTGLAAVFERGDIVEMSQVLAPVQAKLGLGRVTAYTASGKELLHMGPRQVGVSVEPLVTHALGGRTESSVAVTGGGLAVVAVAPVASPRGVVGAVVVGTTLDGDALNEIKDRESVELAVFSDSRLVTTTLDDPSVLAALRESAPAGIAERERLESLLEPLYYRPALKQLPDGGLIVTLVHTRALVEASNQRNAFLVIGTLGLVAALVVIGLVLARDFARPLESMVRATTDMVRGNYQRRVAPSSIRELNLLANAVNHLAEELQHKLAELTHQAFHDGLTNLPNRALFKERVHKALDRSRQTGRGIALLFLDLDNFKIINDSLGHSAGDQLLIAAAERLQQCVRPEDTVARLSGDEFTVLLEGVRDTASALELAENLARRLGEPLALGGRQVFTTASIGLTVCHADQTRGVDDLVREADTAMYRAKARGKARCELFDASMNAEAIERLELESALRGAVDRGELLLHFQPIIDLASSRVVEVEALVRWNHPERGLVPPIQFIGLAEETGLIVPIGRWVLEEACRQVRDWHAERPYDPPLTVSVNLSAMQFQHAGLVADIARVLQESAFDPGSLKLEITESVLMEDAASTVATLGQLRALGIRLAVDDFGTGYSSLNYLKRFPVDTLKVDKAFVDGLGQNADDSAIVRAVIALAKTLSLSVTAEGIETVQQCRLLEQLGCDLGQGYYFARPMPADALGAFLDDRQQRSTWQTAA